jgi:hypothetical protein
LLQLAHPDALLEFRAHRVLQLRALTDTLWPDVGFGAALDSAGRQRIREAQAREWRWMLDSAFSAPDADSLARMAPDSVLARWVRFLRRPPHHAPSSGPSPIQLRLVGTVLEGDTVAYAVVVRRWPTAAVEAVPAEYEILERRREYPDVMVMRRVAGQWRSMLDVTMLSNMAVSVDLLHEK